MNTSGDKLWKLVLEDLQVSLSTAGYSGWIRPLGFSGIVDVDEGRGIATLECPSSFHQQIVEQRFYGQIKEVFDRVCGKTIELKFVVNTALAPAPSTPVGPLFAQQAAVDEAGMALHRVGLREDFTFDTFAVSSSNEMAHAAAAAVSESLGTAYNPLFLYGGVGVGKTHLMQAIGVAVLSKNPQAQIIYCAGEEFTNEIIAAIQQKNTHAFKQRYRNVRVLLIDDIQFIAGKTTVQEEFFHTFNAILRAGGQVVMTSDRPPSEIKALEDRLRSRFEAGLIVDIGEPNFELRAAILLIKARQRGVGLSMEHAQLVAANIESARQIEGFLARLLTEVRLKKKTVDLALIQAILGRSVTPTDSTPPPLRPMEVVRGVADYFSLPSKQVRGAGRARPLVVPRHIAMYLLRVDYKVPLTEVGALFSDRDHTTVMHAVEKITQELAGSEQLRIQVSQIRQRLYQQ